MIPSMNKVIARTGVVATLASAGVIAAAIAGPDRVAGGTERLGTLPAVEAPPLSVDWQRAQTVRALLRGEASAVVARVDATTDAPPITPEDAGAPADTPSLPREVISFTLTDHLAGPPVDDVFDLVRVLPPSGVTAEEDEPYRAGERYLLFVSPAEMPGAWQPRAWQLVSLDGRLKIEPDGRVRGYLPDGPAAEVNRGSSIAHVVEEAAR
jgi:hypothetical protein